jgi:sterol desaturase/sphingolipid hydroxylase (fatty acid hydroxylase superfamily)
MLTAVAQDLMGLALRLVPIIAVLVPLERIFAARKKRLFRHAFLTDLAYYFFGNLLPKLLLVLPLSLLVSALHKALPVAFYAVMSGLPLYLRLALAMLVGETGFYWGHRLMHEIPALWRFHAIHHAAEEMDWLVNTRAHPVDYYLSRLSGLMPIYALGLAQPMAHGVDTVPVLFALIGSFWGFFVHANLRWRLGWLEWVVASPAFHHWHHANDGQAYIDKNYAAMLPCLDMVFGTFTLPRRLPGSYGIDGPMPDGFLNQLAFPFSPAPRPTAVAGTGE